MPANPKPIPATRPTSRAPSGTSSSCSNSWRSTGRFPSSARSNGWRLSSFPASALGLLTFLPVAGQNPLPALRQAASLPLAVMGIMVIVDVVLLTVMASLPAVPDAAELAASATLQAIGGLSIPAAVLTLPWS
ncbi:MAG: hypothetical protein MZV64_58730 [Ignavibacteriales bacterium]|nr:hypothetical protein [Ignavibacteriales bacterium]